MKKWKNRVYALAAALLVTAGIAAGTLRRIDRWAQDWLFQRPGVTSTDIMIIGIDDRAFEMLGSYNTWDRNIMASALEALAVDPQNRPAAVAVDVLYTGYSTEQADERLAKAAQELGNVVTASIADFGEEITWENGRAVSRDDYVVKSYEQPFEELRAGTVQGHINAMADRDGVMRHAVLYVEPEGESVGEVRVYSMACETARLYLRQQGRNLSLPPCNARGQYYIPYTAKPGGYYDGLSIADLISGAIPPEYWAGKIVLIGPYAAALQDAYFTPIDKGTQMFGVEIQANLIQSILEGRFRTEPPDALQLLILFFLLTAAGLVFLRKNVLPGAEICAGVILAGMAGTILFYRLGYVTHPLWLPAGALVLYIFSMALHYAHAAKERHALALEKERIGAELELATRIQGNALPKEFPPFPDRQEFDIFASMTPAKEVGGDLYDYFLLDDDHLCLTIGDVSGKGVPAALFMMVAMALIHHVAMQEKSPAKILQIVNEEICARNPEEMFVTVWLGVLEISTGKLTAANAGHEYPALRTPGGSFALYKDRHGFVIGGMEGMHYREYTISLEPGARLFVYTDGVAEATDDKETLFGTDRMLQALREKEDGSPREILDAVSRAVEDFVGNAPQFDDLTMLCLQYHGVEEPGK